MAAPQLPLQFASDADAVDPALAAFHPLVQRWFQSTLGQPVRAAEPRLAAHPRGRGRPHRRAHGLRARRSPPSSPRWTGSSAWRSRTASRTAPRVVYVSPLKALGNDVQKNLLGPLEAIYELARARGALSRADPRPGAHRGHAGQRAGADGPPAAAHSHHHAGVALPGAHRGPGPRDAAARGHGHRRRDPRPRPGQARQPPRPLARAAEGAGDGAGRSSSGSPPPQKPVETFASFLTGRPEGCAVVQVGHLRKWELALETPEDRAQRRRHPRDVGAGLRPAGAADVRAPDHAHLHQHPEARRARGARPRHAPRPGHRLRPPREHGPRAAAGRRGEAQAGRAPGDGGHRLARAGHRHRGGGPGGAARQPARASRSSSSGWAAPATRCTG